MVIELFATLGFFISNFKIVKQDQSEVPGEKNIIIINHNVSKASHLMFNKLVDVSRESVQGVNV